MVGWIESQRPMVIVLVIFGCSYLVVALLLLVSACLARRPIGADLKATTPVMLTPLSVVIALLIAFLATRVWNNLDRASMPRRQARSARPSFWPMNCHPPSVPVCAGRSGCIWISSSSSDWPAMTAGQLTLKETPQGLADAVHALLSFDPSGRSQEFAQQQLIRAIERTLEARRYRILLSQGSISPLQWLVIAILDVLMLSTIAMVHIERPRTAAINMFSLSTGIAACLVLLMVHDRPFSAGGFTLDPGALREIVVSD